MKIAVIGAGFTGLAAASDLARAGHQVTVFEANEYPGGLAAGFESQDWEWSLEQHYHHIFASDIDIINWLKELGLEKEMFFSRVKTSTYYQGQTFQLDSPLSLLTCPVLSPVAKFRTATTLGFLMLWPFWQVLERITAEKFLRLSMGEEAWRVLWQPLFADKFGKFESEVNAAWFWARIKSRTPQLGYFVGGFGRLAKAAVIKLETLGVQFQLSSPVSKIELVGNSWQVSLALPAQAPKDTKKTAGNNFATEQFDQVLFTGDAGLLTKLVPSLPKAFAHKITQLDSLSARTLILELDRPFFTDCTYWLNVNQVDWPFLAVVEHTNLAGVSHYGGKTIVYVGKYLDSSSKLYQLSQAQLVQAYKPYLNQLSPGFDQHITHVWDYKAKFAQPVVKLRHSQNVPPFTTPLPGLYWASMQHVYPWDRGTNFAVKVGRQVAGLITA